MTLTLTIEIATGSCGQNMLLARLESHCTGEQEAAIQTRQICAIDAALRAHALALGLQKNAPVCASAKNPADLALPQHRRNN